MWHMSNGIDVYDFFYVKYQFNIGSVTFDSKNMYINGFLMGTRRNNNVIMTSKWRRDVVSTS